jgi:hypothetical protein
MASGEMSEAEFRSFLADTLGAAAHVSRDVAVHFICMDWRHMDDVSERPNLCISPVARRSVACAWRAARRFGRFQVLSAWLNSSWLR